jgi:hypothetical protein
MKQEIAAFITRNRNTAARLDAARAQLAAAHAVLAALPEPSAAERLALQALDDLRNASRDMREIEEIKKDRAPDWVAYLGPGQKVKNADGSFVVFKSTSWQKVAVDLSPNWDPVSLHKIEHAHTTYRGRLSTAKSDTARTAYLRGVF